MVKITKVNGQFRITIPKEIADLKAWDENTDLYVIPYMAGPDSGLDKDTPIMLIESKRKKK